MMKSSVGVLDKAVVVLDALDAAPATLDELARRTGLPVATAHRLVHALEAHRLTRFEDGRWHPGPRLAPPLHERSRAVLEELRDRTGETAQLDVLRGGLCVCVAAVPSRERLRVVTDVGATVALSASAAGIVLSAPPDSAESGWATHVDRDGAVATVAGPVVAGGRVVAAVSVSVPTARGTRTPGDVFGEAVAEAARAIEQAVGSR
jgi:DNA-binding IclR family transcriptional regulator